ncbi:hypothetical protein QPK87_14065 [Kamptonema cortianum]|nr:hypothetical protein [Geitlerinema splendidum]MDK3157693.1 hypothetical protein [Kamptonema cortianum]
MLWTQAIVCLVLWIGAGGLVARQSHKNPPRLRSAFGASLLMVAGAAVMLAGMALVAVGGGFVGGQLTSWAWAVTLVLGTVFVTMQTYGASAVMAALARRETSSTKRASESEETPD